jgi:carboxylesterase
LRNVRVIERGVRAPVETLLLDNSYHMITVDQERDQVVERSTKFFNHVANTRFVHMPVAAPALATVD